MSGSGVNYASLSAPQLKAIILGADIEWFTRCANQFQDFVDNLTNLQSRLDTLTQGFAECWQGQAADNARNQAARLAATPEIAVHDGSSAANACHERSEHMTRIQNQVATMHLTDTSIGGMIKRGAIGAAIGGPTGSGLAIYHQQRQAEQEKRQLLQHVENLDNQGQHLADTMKTLRFTETDPSRRPISQVPDVLPGEQVAPVPSDPASSVFKKTDRVVGSRPSVPHHSSSPGLPVNGSGSTEIGAASGSSSPVPAGTAPSSSIPAAQHNSSGTHLTGPTTGAGSHGSSSPAINGFDAIAMAAAGGLLGAGTSTLTTPNDPHLLTRSTGQPATGTTHGEHPPHSGQQTGPKNTPTPPEHASRNATTTPKPSPLGENLPGALSGAKKDEEKELRPRPEYLVATEDLWGTIDLVPPAVIE